MKSLKPLLFLSSLLLVVLFSCTKDEKKNYLTGGNPPALTASVTGSIPLTFINKDNPALIVSWTNPNYQFTTGISSQDVSYIVEIDTTGANFSNPAKQTISVSKDLNRTFTQGEFNDFLLNQLVLKPGVPHNLEIRVISSLANGKAAQLASNVLKFVVVPYAIPPKVPPPTTGRLYLVGSATAGGWNNPVPEPTQEFTKVSETLFELTVTLSGGAEYLFLPLNGDWGHKYAVKDNTLSGLAEGGDFGYDFSKNFPGPAAAGKYKIIVDFQRGKSTVKPA